jgi:hypothetical protein
MPKDRIDPKLKNRKNNFLILFLELVVASSIGANSSPRDFINLYTWYERFSPPCPDGLGSNADK